jgi:hypothetical protein
MTVFGVRMGDEVNIARTPLSKKKMPQFFSCSPASGRPPECNAMRTIHGTVMAGLSLEALTLAFADPSQTPIRHDRACPGHPRRAVIDLGEVCSGRPVSATIADVQTTWINQEL